MNRLTDAEFEALLESVQSGQAPPDDLDPEDAQALEMAARLSALQARAAPALRPPWSEPGRGADGGNGERGKLVPLAGGRGNARSFSGRRLADWALAAGLAAVALLGLAWLATRAPMAPESIGDNPRQVGAPTRAPGGEFSLGFLPAATPGVLPELRVLGRSPVVSPCCAMTATDGLVVVSAPAVHVYDVSDPALALHIARSAPLPGMDYVQGGAVEGDLVYLVGPLTYTKDRVNGYGGLRILRVARPGDATAVADMPLVGALDTRGKPNGLAVQGQHAFIADRLDGLLVVDVTTPETPRVVGTTPTRGQAVSLVVAGGMAFVANSRRESDAVNGVGESGLEVFDVRDPTAPRSIAFLAADVSFVTPGQYLAYSDGAVFLATTTSVWRVDVTDPTAPRRVAEVTAQDQEGLWRGVNWLVADPRGFLFGATDQASSVAVFDVRAGGLRSIGNMPGVGTGGVARVPGDTPVLATIPFSPFEDSPTRLVLTDLSDVARAATLPAAEVTLGSVDLSPDLWSMDWHGDQRGVYSKTDGRLGVLGVGSDGGPVLWPGVGSARAPRIVRMSPDGNLAFAAESEPFATGSEASPRPIERPRFSVHRADSGVCPIDQEALPECLEELGAVVLRGPARSMVVSRDLAFIAEAPARDGEPAGLEIVDLREPSRPTVRGSLVGEFTGLAVDGSRLAIVGPCAVQPAAASPAPSATPTPASTSIPPYPGPDGGNTHAPGSSDRPPACLVTVDVADPDHPRRIGEVRLVAAGEPLELDPRDLVTMAVVGQTGYLLVNGRLFVIDLDAWAEPKLVGEPLAVGTGAWGHASVAVNGQLLYAAQTDGVTVFDLSSPRQPVAVASHPDDDVRGMALGGDSVVLRHRGGGLTRLAAPSRMP